MPKSKNQTIRSKVMKILQAHGANTDYELANKLYLSQYGRKLANQTFYQYRREYQEQLKKEGKKECPTDYTVKVISPNFFAAAEKEAETPVAVCPQQKETYSFCDLKKISCLAKEMGGLQYLKEGIEALASLQE